MMLLNTSHSIFCTFQFPFDVKFDSLMQETYKCPRATLWSPLLVIWCILKLYSLIRAKLVSFLDQAIWSNFKFFIGLYYL